MWCKNLNVSVSCSSALHFSFTLPLTQTQNHLQVSWLKKTANFLLQVETCLGEIIAWYCALPELPVDCPYSIIVAVLLLPLCVPACLSEWPCGICMVIEIITASSLYLRLISPCCLMPWVETSNGKLPKSLRRRATAADNDCAMQFSFFFHFDFDFLNTLLSASPCFTHS